MPSKIIIDNYSFDGVTEFISEEFVISPSTPKGDDYIASFNLVVFSAGKVATIAPATKLYLQYFSDAFNDWMYLYQTGGKAEFRSEGIIAVSSLITGKYRVSVEAIDATLDGLSLVIHGEVK